MLKYLERCNKHDMMQYEMANGNMLHTIYNVQYVICNLSAYFFIFLAVKKVFWVRASHFPPLTFCQGLLKRVLIL
jgi:hypothetical protein